MMVSVTTLLHEIQVIFTVNSCHRNILMQKVVHPAVYAEISGGVYNGLCSCFV